MSQPPPRPKNRASDLLAKNGDVLRLAVIAVLIFAVMGFLRPELFLTATNFTSMAFQFPEFAILSLAMMLAMLTGGIDLSIIAVMNFSAILGGIFLASTPLAPGLAIAITIAIMLATGLACGAVNGLLVSRIDIPPILATLGTSQVFLGLGIVLTGGAAVHGFPPAFATIGTARVLGIPLPLLVFAAIAVVVAFALNRTTYGFRLYLFGTNARAARFAGLPTPRLVMATYMTSGLLAAVAGVIIMARVNSIRADFGASYLLLTILVAVLGGVNPYGGYGKVLGVVLAVVSLQFISSGLNMLRFSNFTREFVWGALLLLVMALSSQAAATGARRLRGMFGRDGSRRDAGAPHD
jgi:simple sugar transport system permease protein